MTTSNVTALCEGPLLLKNGDATTKKVKNKLNKYESYYGVISAEEPALLSLYPSLKEYRASSTPFREGLSMTNAMLEKGKKKNKLYVTSQGIRYKIKAVDSNDAQRWLNALTAAMRSDKPLYGANLPAPPTPRAEDNQGQKGKNGKQGYQQMLDHESGELLTDYHVAPPPTTIFSWGRLINNFRTPYSGSDKFEGAKFSARCLCGVVWLLLRFCLMWTVALVAVAAGSVLRDGWAPVSHSVQLLLLRASGILLGVVVVLLLVPLEYNAPRESSRCSLQLTTQQKIKRAEYQRSINPIADRNTTLQILCNMLELLLPAVMTLCMLGTLLMVLLPGQEDKFGDGAVDSHYHTPFEHFHTLVSEELSGLVVLLCVLLAPLILLLDIIVDLPCIDRCHGHSSAIGWMMSGARIIEFLLVMSCAIPGVWLLHSTSNEALISQLDHNFPVATRIGTPFDLPRRLLSLNHYLECGGEMVTSNEFTKETVEFKSVSTPPENPSGKFVFEAYQGVSAEQARGESLKMDIYHPAHPLKETHNPTVIFWHGGCMVSGTKDMWMPNCWFKDLLHAGITVVSPEYRLGGFGWNIADIYQDAVDSVEFVASHLQLDSEKDIIVSGCSAGGQLAMLVSLRGTMVHDAPRVLAAMPISGQTDMLLGLMECRVLVCEGLPEETPECWKNYSPIHFIEGSSPPQLFFHGRGDTLSPQANGHVMNNALENASVAHAFVNTPAGGHCGTFDYDGIDGQAWNYASRQFLESVLDMPIRFKESHHGLFGTSQ